MADVEGDASVLDEISDAVLDWTDPVTLTEGVTETANVLVDEISDAVTDSVTLTEGVTETVVSSLTKVVLISVANGVDGVDAKVLSETV